MLVTGSIQGLIKTTKAISNAYIHKGKQYRVNNELLMLVHFGKIVCRLRNDSYNKTEKTETYILVLKDYKKEQMHFL